MTGQEDLDKDPGSRDTRRWWRWAVTVVVVVALGAVAAFAIWGGNDDDPTTTGATTTERSTTTTSTSSTSSTTTTTAPDATTTTTTTQSGAVPGTVSVITAGPGGGSGEVELAWDAVAGATGYRVLRGAAIDGPFGPAADLDVTTGSTTASPGVVNIFSEQHSYLPSDGPLGAPDQSPRFQYVEVTSGERCFRVIAYNAVGNGPASTSACGSPP
jgi:cytoskeletal protein RodZ